MIVYEAECSARDDVFEHLSECFFERGAYNLFPLHDLFISTCKKG